MKKIAINGFGRIGRQTLRILMRGDHDLEVVAINDLTDVKTLAHLFEFDSTYGPYQGKVEVQGSDLVIDGKKIQALAEPDPTKLPWGKLGIDVVLECTGVFCSREKAGLHLKAGAKKIVLSAPAKDEIDGTFVMGVNEKMYDAKKHHIISNASCTTNCLAPIAKVLHEKFEIIHGLMTTIHAYTNDQKILDLPHKDLRRARSAGQNLIPTSTGAAKAVGLVIPELKGKLNGMAIRVPTATVSLVDLTVEVKKATTVEEVNAALKDAAKKMPKVIRYEDRPLVSKDFQGDPHSTIVDALSTQVMEGNMVKVLSWYDNEWGYSERLVDLCEYIAK